MVYLSSTNHEEDQPVHLNVGDFGLQTSGEYHDYGGPSANYCPAGVYEWILEGGFLNFRSTLKNCVHCKTCDIKDPNQNINWQVPRRWWTKLLQYVILPPIKHVTKVVLQANAKINLTLDILGKRSDNYHDIQGYVALS